MSEEYDFGHELGNIPWVCTLTIFIETCVVGDWFDIIETFYLLNLLSSF